MNFNPVFKLGRLFLLLLVLSAVYGCGQKGDLYLPDQATQNQAAPGS